jgi:hypothetical protein
MWSVPRCYEERTLARETEEFSLLEVVAGEQLVKTRQTGKGLVGAVNCGD